MIIGGAYGDMLQGNAGNDVIRGDSGLIDYVGTGSIDGIVNQVLSTSEGVGGDDLINGDAGNDTIIGGAGNDTYVVSTAADVIVENFRPDVKRRLKIDYKDVQKINPKIVYGSISGFGQNGPYENRPGFDQIAQGMGVAGIGPITDPKDLAPALKRAIAIVKGGEPCLIDVVTQGR